MSFLDAFRKPKPVDILDSEMQPKTLDQALALIVSQETQIQGLQTTVTERDAAIASLNTDLDACMTTFGIEKKTENDLVTWNSSHVDSLDESLQNMTAERDQLQKELGTANGRIAELEKDQRTVSARAREFLASQGGKPLPVTSNGMPKANNRVALSEALDEANRAGNKEEVKRLYGELTKLRN